MKHKKRVIVIALVIAAVLSFSGLTAYALSAGAEEQTAAVEMTVADCCG